MFRRIALAVDMSCLRHQYLSKRSRARVVVALGFNSPFEIVHIRICFYRGDHRSSKGFLEKSATSIRVGIAPRSLGVLQFIVAVS